MSDLREPAPASGGLSDGPPVDPNTTYRLDSDAPPRVKSDSYPNQSRVPEHAWNGLDPSPADMRSVGRQNVSYLRGGLAERLPWPTSRQFHLASWIAKVAHEPACAWWAGQQQALHPYILRNVRKDQQNSSRPKPNKAVSECWSNIREYHLLKRNDWDSGYDFSFPAQASGRHNALTWEYASHFAPSLKNKLQPLESSSS